ncbi:MAG TPA: phosphoheptose isomerase [Thermoanaerobaculia bacterium]|nr:phosphoheptose isomerase [Thermoanaerobaculia bacterium]
MKASEATGEVAKLRATLGDAELRALGAARFERMRQAVDAFFGVHADQVPEVCRAMARRFHAGGRLLSWGGAAAGSDAWHVAVEFVHPVIVGKRALPALVLGEEPLAHLALLGRPVDIVLMIGTGGVGGTRERLLSLARQRGLLTLSLGGRAADTEPRADFSFGVADDDPTVVQEVHETLYHVLWELVHVFLEQPESL